MKKILWISNHPTNYLIYLFNFLNKHFELKVFFLEFIKSTHPWGSLTHIDFDYYVLNNKFHQFFKIIKKAKESNSTLIIANWNKISINLLFLVCIIKKIRFAIWTDTPNIYKKRFFIKYFIRNFWLNYVVNQSIAIMGTGDISKDMFTRMGFKENKQINFPFFVDLEKFRPKIQTSNLFDNELVFISSGRLVNSHKGYDVAIEALNLFRNKTGYSSFKYKIAGSGPDKKIIEAQIKRYNLQSNVIFVGWLEESQLLEFYGSGNIFLHPSRFDPFPNCVLEAMACGLTVIGSSTAGSVKERIIHMENGLIFKSENAIDLAHQIEYIHNNRHMLKIFGKNARIKSEEWSINRSKDILVSFI